MKHAAADGMIVIVRCGLCKRTENFLAVDLVDIVGGDHVTYLPPFPRCGRCGKFEYLSTSLRMPEAGDYGSLRVRRPAGFEVSELWTTVLLGDEPKVKLPHERVLARLRHGLSTGAPARRWYDRGKP